MKMSLCGDDIDEEDDLPEDWDAISMAS